MRLYTDKELFQWEKNRFIFVESYKTDPLINYLQFYNKDSKCGPEVPVVGNKAKIPDYLLEKNLPIMALACTGKPGETLVVCRHEFKVVGRAMPEKYEDESDEPPVPGEPEKPDYDDEEIIYDGGEEE